MISTRLPLFLSSRPSPSVIQQICPLKWFPSRNSKTNKGQQYLKVASLTISTSTRLSRETSVRKTRAIEYLSAFKTKKGNGPQEMVYKNAQTQKTNLCPVRYASSPNFTNGKIPNQSSGTPHFHSTFSVQGITHDSYWPNPGGNKRHVLHSLGLRTQQQRSQ
jgi:hypothetical protein